MLNLWFVLPVAAVVVGFGLNFVLLKAMRAGSLKRLPAPAPGRDDKTIPGRLLAHKIRLVSAELKAHLICALIQPLVLLAIIMPPMHFTSEAGLQVFVTAAVACGLVFLFCLWNLIRLLKARKHLLLSLDAEIEVGKALDQLSSRGYHVVHDFSAESVTIDHIAVGPKGVFAIKTLAHPKSASGKRSADGTVSYNGRVLFFPRKTDESTVSGAVRQAELLSDWIGGATGEPVAARAVVAIPGWLVRRTSSEGVAVVNPNRFSSLFEHISARPLSPAQIERIVDRLKKEAV